MMATVTGRIKEITQPRGGYVKPKDFNKRVRNDGKNLSTVENVSPIIVGTVVDYMTRFLSRCPVEEAFSISLRGMAIKEQYTGNVGTGAADLTRIKGTDGDSIVAACRLASYDVWFRNPMEAAMRYEYDVPKEPDAETIENIRIMIQRGVSFWKEYGPVTSFGFDFQPNGYTATVSTGDGDFLTADTLWDFKVSKNTPTSKNTLQILMYWIMGQHSGNPIFRNISRIGIFNPRLNTVYTLDMSKVPASTIRAVENDVIGY